MELPVESFVRAVDGNPDLFAFTYDFGVEGIEGKAVTEAENGDLIIEGYAAIWDGDDRQGENFMPGVFQRGIKAFLDQSAALCFHHKRDHVLGKVLQLEERDKGLYMKARVDGATRQHPVLGTLYQQIKNGTLTGLSVGGWFKRAMVEGKRKIADMDFSEISVTGVPIHTGPRFDVIAGKALENDVHEPAPIVEPEGKAELDEAAITEAVERKLASYNAFLDLLSAVTMDAAE